MGTYNVSLTEIIEELIEALDNIEGDFSNDDLHKSLTFMHGYPYTSDGSKVREKQWKEKLKEKQNG